MKTRAHRFLPSLAAMILCILLPHNAQAIALKGHAVLQDNVIRLGDIFSGLPNDDRRVLGAAPQPGQDMVLNARTLMRVAMAMDLDWRPVSSAQSITIKRAATLIHEDEIEDAVIQALSTHGIESDLALTLSTTLTPITLPTSEPAELAVHDLRINHEKNWFEANISAPSTENPLFTSRIAGRFDRLVSVPVLSGSLRAGDIIGARDISTIKMKEREINHDVILDKEAIIGMTPRRIAHAGKPVKEQDIEPPRMVERGDIVTITFSQGGVKLTARGKAMEHGAQGDLIRVVNTSSHRSLDAFVSNHKEVTVTHF